MGHLLCGLLCLYYWTGYTKCWFLAIVLPYACIGVPILLPSLIMWMHARVSLFILSGHGLGWLTVIWCMSWNLALHSFPFLFDVISSLSSVFDGFIMIGWSWNRLGFDSAIRYSGVIQSVALTPHFSLVQVPKGRHEDARMEPGRGSWQQVTSGSGPTVLKMVATSSLGLIDCNSYCYMIYSCIFYGSGRAKPYRVFLCKNFNWESINTLSICKSNGLITPSYIYVNLIDAWLGNSKRW